MAKEKIQALLWNKEDHSYYARSAYFYTDLKDLLNYLLSKEVSPDDLENFKEKLQTGKIKHCQVVKNHNGRKDESPFQSIKDGGLFIRNRVTKDSFKDGYEVMDSKVRFSWRSDMTYCELSTPRDLFDSEREIIEEVLGQALGTSVQDKVFNIFALLCSAKDVVWKVYDSTKTDKSFYNDKRERSFLGFDTMDLYHAEDVETRERVAKRIATCAWMLTKQLTGYELHLKDYPDDDFVDGLMAARYLQNENIIVKKVMEPTLTMKGLLKLATAKSDVADGNIIAAQVCLSKIIKGTGGRYKRRLEELLSMDGIRKVEAKPYATDTKFDDFKNVDNCLVWSDTGNEKQNFTVYIWDDLITTYDLMGSDESFCGLIKNK